MTETKSSLEARIIPPLRAKPFELETELDALLVSRVWDTIYKMDLEDNIRALRIIIRLFQKGKGGLMG